MNYHTVTDDRDEEIWNLLLAHAGEKFKTARGLPFTYHQKISRDGLPPGELVIDRKEKTITRKDCPCYNPISDGAFTKDYTFRSISEAASVVAGHGMNGLDCWKAAD